MGLAVRTVVVAATPEATTVAITVAADQVAHTYAQPRPIPALALLSTIPKAGHAGCRQKQRSLASSPMASATVRLGQMPITNWPVQTMAMAWLALSPVTRPHATRVLITITGSKRVRWANASTKKLNVPRGILSRANSKMY